MEQKFLLTEDMLWDYADGFLSSEEKIRVDEYLRQSPEYQSMLDTILAEKRAMRAVPSERPSAGFADSVMAAWVAEQVGQRQLSGDKGKDWIAYAIAIAMGTFIFLPIVLMLFSAGSGNIEAVPVPYLQKTPNIPWATIFTHPAMRIGLPLMLVYFSFRFLDQYLQQKKLLARLHV